MNLIPKFKKNRGITLIALVVTIIVLLLLAGIAITMATGQNGIITKSVLASFATEMQQIQENVEMKKSENAMNVMKGDVSPVFDTNVNRDNIEWTNSLKQEILYIRAGYPSEQEPSDYTEDDFEEIIDENGNVENIFIIDKETADGKENTYIYDMTTNVAFKIKPTSIAGKKYHSYALASIGKGSDGSSDSKKDAIIDKESEMVNVGEEYYYAPNMKGFSSKDTSLVYYSADFSVEKDIPIKQYIEDGEKNAIEEGSNTYTLHDYGKQIWANAKTTANGLEAWWVWVPRYAYKINGTNVTSPENPIDVIYIDVNNKPMNPKYNGVLPEGYEPHPAFTVNGNELRGIWMSKYEPSYQSSATPVDGVLAPDLSGFDPQNTYIELYDKTTGDFKQEIKLADANLATINQNKEWYDYPNKVWANIKTNANGTEAWWVWIPRYAYRMDAGSTTTAMTGVVFVDLNNKPINKEQFPDGLSKQFTIHPAFTAGDKQLKGIWMSKYEPSYQTNNKGVDGVLAPDMEGFDSQNTYIELYDQETGDFKEEVKLADADLTIINKNKEWYDYPNKVWANIKTNANGLEAWWVWIPRYAYVIQAGSTTTAMTGAVFVGLDNQPINKEAYPNGLSSVMQVHPAFTVDGKELSGIWMSKYEPSKK